MDHVDVPVRVRYADTDRMGVVYYGNYPQFFEMGRTEFMREKGFVYREFEEQGYHLVVTALEVKYYNSATYDDLLIVRTRVGDVQSRALTFYYTVMKDEVRVVEGKTRHVCVTRDMKPARFPDALMEVLHNVRSA